MYVGDTIETTKTIPDEYDSWIDVANTKLNEVDNLDIDMKDNVVTITKKDGTTKSENVKGEKGETPVKGKDYYTPEEIDEVVNEVINSVDELIQKAILDSWEEPV